MFVLNTYRSPPGPTPLMMAAVSDSRALIVACSLLLLAPAAALRSSCRLACKDLICTRNPHYSDVLVQDPPMCVCTVLQCDPPQLPGHLAHQPASWSTR